MVEIRLSEGSTSNVKTVKTLLNITDADSADPRVRAKVAQELYANLMRERFPEISEDVSNDELVTQDRMREVMEELGGKLDQARQENTLYLPNHDLENVTDFPFMEAKIYDYKSLSDDEQPAFQDILTHEEFLEMLVFPSIKDYNLNAIWEDNLSLCIRTSEVENQIEKHKLEVKAQEESMQASQEGLDKLEQDLLTAEGLDAQNKLETSITEAKETLVRTKGTITSTHAEISAKEELLQRVAQEGLSAFDNNEQGKDDQADDLTSLDMDNVDALDLCENRSKTGLGVTTITCRIADEGDDLDEDAPMMMSNVHVIKSELTDTTLVVANDVKPSLRKAFESAKVQFIDVKDKNASKKIDEAVSGMVRGLKDSEMTLGLLKTAFKMRNGSVTHTDEVETNEETLGSLMTKRTDFDFEQRLEKANPTMKFFSKPYLG